jgi:hypothetical protein
VLHGKISQNHGLRPELWRWRYAQGRLPSFTRFIPFAVLLKAVVAVFFFEIDSGSVFYCLFFSRKPTKWTTWKKACSTWEGKPKKVIKHNNNSKLTYHWLHFGSVPVPVEEPVLFCAAPTSAPTNFAIYFSKIFIIMFFKNIPVNDQLKVLQIK